MKKIAFVLLLLISLTVVAGCNARRNTVRFDNNNADTTAPADDKTAPTDEKTEPKKEAAGEGDVITTVVTPQKDEKKEPLKVEVKKEEVKVKVKDKVVAAPTAVFAVTPPAKSTKATQTVRGTTPSNTAKVQVNGSDLKSYIAGHKNWTFVASTKSDNLKEGDNTYTVKSYDKDGVELGSKDFTLTYKAPVVQARLPQTGPSIYLMMVLSLLAGFGYSLLKNP